ncbi:hypothetical protein D8674_028673 [Pyrus ussuriensis x Pyrus communis]|uniref:Uncharacterized protein n=1 Tax=Pyrus ussuriensis x Pyrus communis TaxID=2448454 RepID=A0A5N5HWY6_9ROSA|nr:hypothetical protein D8674_028673 [Pyrus ussuriensis x Pyrus communis]
MEFNNDKLFSSPFSVSPSQCYFPSSHQDLNLKTIRDLLVLQIDGWEVQISDIGLRRWPFKLKAGVGEVCVSEIRSRRGCRQ